MKSTFRSLYLCLFACSFALAGCLSTLGSTQASDQRAFESASQANSIESYEAFLKIWHRSPKAVDAQLQLDRLKFERIRDKKHRSPYDLADELYRWAFENASGYLLGPAESEFDTMFSAVLRQGLSTEHWRDYTSSLRWYMKTRPTSKFALALSQEFHGRLETEAVEREQLTRRNETERSLNDLRQVELASLRRCDVGELLAHPDKFPKSQHLHLIADIAEGIRAHCNALEELFSKNKQSNVHITQYHELLPKSPYSDEAHRVIRTASVGEGIFMLSASGDVEVEASGAGLTAIHLKVRRTSRFPIVVKVPAGTLFLDESDTRQNMAIRKETAIELASQSWKSVSLPAACASLRRPEPDSSTRLTLAKWDNSTRAFGGLLRRLESENASFAVTQAAVWLATDNASYAELGRLQTAGSGTERSRAIGPQEAARAMWFVNSAGISLTTIWNDYRTLLDGVADEELRKFLQRGRQ